MRLCEAQKLGSPLRRGCAGKPLQTDTAIDIDIDYIDIATDSQTYIDTDMDV